jgi:hypothetical protein
MTISPGHKRLRSLFLTAAAIPLVLPLSGCLSLFTSTRKLPVPVAPSAVKTDTPEELVGQVNSQWDKFESLTATVEILASRLKPEKGVATDYPTFRANLLAKKPNMLRFLGHVPVVQTKMFDMATDGTNFTLVVPPKSLVFTGLNASKGTSLNWYENLRPGFLFDAMIVRGLAPDDLYSVISQTITEQNPKTKRLISMPEYVLNIVRRRPNSQELYPVRVIHFRRTDLLPYEQDLYDDTGRLETQVNYGPYQDFNGTTYPSTITLKRPLENYQLSATIERVTLNTPLTNEQFHEDIPDGYKKVELK